MAGYRLSLAYRLLLELEFSAHLLSQAKAQSQPWQSLAVPGSSQHFLAAPSSSSHASWQLLAAPGKS